MIPEGECQITSPTEMKTSIEFINHASVIVGENEVSVLSDPWFRGDAFHKGWNLLHETSDEEAEKILDKITHIWLSHEHPDHFSVLFFKTFRQKIINSSIKILFQETEDKRVLKFLKSLSLECEELKFNKETHLSKSFSITCIKDGFYDSGLLIQNGEEKILNLNDCEVTSLPRAQEVYSITGQVDVLLTQFSFAAWKGGKKNKRWRDEAAQEKLKTMELQIEQFKPKYVIPFASYVYFSNTENNYLNDAVNKPREVVKRFADSNVEVVVMKPKDKLGGDNAKVAISDALEFWEGKYDSIDLQSLNSYSQISLEEIYANFHKYCERTSNKNSLWLIKLVRTISPISAFKPVIINISDLDCTVKFDYVTSEIAQVNDEAMLSMKSESLNFLFQNSFGFDTLTVNGCFEEEKQGGFVQATKTLAIENLNNLGINIAPRTLLNFSIIRLFLTRLYRVSRKILRNY